MYKWYLFLCECHFRTSTGICRQSPSLLYLFLDVCKKPIPVSICSLSVCWLEQVWVYSEFPHPKWLCLKAILFAGTFAFVKFFEFCTVEGISCFIDDCSYIFLFSSSFFLLPFSIIVTIIYWTLLPAGSCAKWLCIWSHLLFTTLSGIKFFSPFCKGGDWSPGQVNHAEWDPTGSMSQGQGQTLHLGTAVPKSSPWSTAICGKKMRKLREWWALAEPPPKLRGWAALCTEALNVLSFLISSEGGFLEP